MFSTFGAELARTMARDVEADAMRSHWSTDVHVAWFVDEANSVRMEERMEERMEARMEERTIVTVTASIRAHLFMGPSDLFGLVHDRNVFELHEVSVREDRRGERLFTGMLAELLRWVDANDVACSGVLVHYCCDGAFSGHLTSLHHDLYSGQGFQFQINHSVWFKREEQ